MEQISSLTLSIAKPALARLEPDVLIVIAKATGNSPPNIAWLAIPAKERTTIAWDERYGLYASQTPLRWGAEIEVRSSIYPAVDHHVYPYAADRFNDPLYGNRVPHGHYDVRNDDPAVMTFGLLQTAWIDARAVRCPLNAVVVPENFTADFAVVPRIYVWTQRAIAACSVLTEIPGTARAIEFDGANASKSYRYDVDGTAFVEA
jgi:hypothetical protein